MSSADRPVVPVWRDAVLDSSLCPRDKLVALAVSRHFDGQGRGAWPSLSTLARYCSLSRSTVQLGIDSLDSCGWLDVERRGKVRRPNVYAAAFPKGQTRAYGKPGRARKRKEAVADDFAEYAA